MHPAAAALDVKQRWLANSPELAATPMRPASVVSEFVLADPWRVPTVGMNTPVPVALNDVPSKSASTPNTILLVCQLNPMSPPPMKPL
jgi:hypothetical protein